MAGAADAATMVVPGHPAPQGASSSGSDGASKNDKLSLQSWQSARRISSSSNCGGAWQGHGQEDVAKRDSDRTSLLDKGKSAHSKGLITWMRAALLHSRWYHSASANRVRAFLNGKTFALVMFMALILALFMPDLWRLCGVNNNEALDATLTLVMFLFTVELVCLSIVDSGYFLSFFQFMDIVGTVSMIFDISYMQGEDNTASQLSSSDGGAQENLMLLRASRAAKIGARAGRLSRVLRILRFLPLLTGGSKDKGSTGIASLISGQLANLLATRVACLTIILVMAIPLFDIWTFPQFDYSLQTWVDRLATHINTTDPSCSRVNRTIAELALMEDFYDERYNYWPYKACKVDRDRLDEVERGTAVTSEPYGTYICEPDWPGLSAWSSSRPGPGRQASVWLIISESGTAMVAFNMHAPIQLKAAMNITTTAFIIVIMVFSGLALSSVVQELAVRPLERMLDTVRQIATTVFKFSAELSEHEEDETADIASSNEMKLLEKVVQKLAIIANLQADNHLPETTKDMNDEEIGIINMMRGTNIAEEANAQQHRKTQLSMPRKKALVPTIRLEDLGVSQELLNSWNFNSLLLLKAQRMNFAVFTVSRFHETGEDFVRNQEEAQTLQRFVQAVEKEYLPVPFHSFAHAIDVAHAVARLMRATASEGFLSDPEQYAMLISGLAHDIGHPGVNNGFLSEVGHELALLYNDRSPLENMHCAKLFTIVANPATNVFSMFAQENYKDARKNCIEAILHTDMMVHQEMVKDLQMTYQMNQEVFGNMMEGLGCPVAEAEIFSEPATKLLVMECILHSADVSNPCRSWEVTREWAWVCLEEFFAQGDQERLLGIPVQFLNDREKLNKPNSQIGFIEFMIAPFLAAQIRLWPPLRGLGEHLGDNLARWEEMWEQEVNPSDEDKQKMRGRVEKVKDSLHEATVTFTARRSSTNA